MNRHNYSVEKLGNLLTDVIDCPHSTPEWTPTGKRVVRNFNLKDGSLDFSDGYFVAEETYDARTRRGKPEAGDIIISREAPIGTVGIVPPGLECCLGQRLVLLKVDKKKCSPYYLLFALMSEYAQTQFRRANATGSIASNLTIPDLREITVPIVANHREAGDLLRSINEAIQINRQINDKLHCMVYDHYMRRFFGKQTNGVISDILIEHAKSTIQVGDAKGMEGEYPFFTSGDAILEWPVPLVDGRCTLLNTGGNADVKFYAGGMAYSTDTWCISAKDGLSDYLYLLLFSIKLELDKKFFLGTGLKHLQKPLLRDRPIYIPSEDEKNAFNKVAVPALTLISANQRENRNLKELRDWLLPMLMNGQASVRPPASS